MAYGPTSEKTADRPNPFRALFALLARLTGVPEPRWRVPHAVGLAAAYANEFLANVWRHRPPVATITGVKLAWFKPGWHEGGTP